MTIPERSWPPPPDGQMPEASASEDGAGEALHHGWRLLVLGLCCAPPVFLPLAAWQAVTANRRRAGAGTALLLAVAGVSALWLAGLLLLARFGGGE